MTELKKLGVSDASDVVSLSYMIGGLYILLVM